MAKPKYEMRMSLNVLNHLGLNLYSNVPAVLSEVVANAWDADATHVDIVIESGKITITDDGHGMSVTDINEKYLNVGYERRKKEKVQTPAYNRPVMGRKGIGKLSLFSIANTVEVQTVRDGKKSGFVMSVAEIRAAIAQEGNTYFPKSMGESDIVLDKAGTQIVLTDLKKRVSQTTSTALRKRLARRFSIIGTEYKFDVAIDGEPVAIADRDYFHKLQYLWYFGSESEKYVELSNRLKSSQLEHHEKKACDIEVLSGDDAVDGRYRVTGWIGTVRESGDLNYKDAEDNLNEDNLNKIVVMVRGKLAQEDILEDFLEGGLYTKYLIGEIHADFLDQDDADDIATTSRQEIIKDDPRYRALQNWVRKELKHIQSQWTELRAEQGTREARQIPAIAKWMDDLKGDRKQAAKTLFGKIGILGQEDDRITLYTQCVLAFESLVYKDRLSALKNLRPQNISAFTKVFADLAEIEASHYYQIVNERLQVIEALDQMVEENELERMVQDYLCDHLWLLDPSWERATDALYIEQKVKTAFEGIKAQLTPDEENGRVDIRYKKATGQHIIIELKRPALKLNDSELIGQVDKYRTALRALLDQSGDIHQPIEIVCIVGEKLKQWTNPAEREMSEKSLAAKSIRVVLYQELIKDAYRSYREFLDKRKEAGRVCRLIQNIETEAHRELGEVSDEQNR